MNLGFSVKWGKEMPEHLAETPTYFIQQINNALVDLGICTIDEITEYEEAYFLKFGEALVPHDGKKLHSIRGDMRWEKDKLIHFCIYNRSPKRFQFAPILKVKNVQTIRIYYEYPNNADYYPLVWVDNELMDIKQIYQIAINDGFESIDDFFAWFSKDFSGKIIHWTDLMY